MERAEEGYKCITDEAIRRRIESREDYERRQRTLRWQLAEKDRQMAEKDSEIADLKRRMAEAGLL